MSIETIDPKEMREAARAGTLSDEEVDPKQIYSSATGEKLQYGNDDPNVLGPDNPPPVVQARAFRDPHKYPMYPSQVFQAEMEWVLPLAKYLAEHCVVDLIDETSYNKLQKEIRQQFLFCVLDISDLAIHENVATWPGIRIWCKMVPVVEVMCRLDLALNIVTVPYVRVWMQSQKAHAKIGDKTGMKHHTREDVARIVPNYLAQEGIWRPQ